MRGAIGDLDTTMPTEPDRFACVNDDTTAAVLVVVATAVDQLLQVVEWANPRIADKSEACTGEQIIILLLLFSFHIDKL